MDRPVEPRSILKVRFPGGAGADSLVSWSYVIYSVKQAPDHWLTGLGFLTDMPDEWLQSFVREYGPLPL
jgi:hypothetical protein